ncbi:MAG: hypothetical protein ACYDDE_07150 [bacterium]
MDIYKGKRNIFLIFDYKVIEDFNIKKKKNIYSKFKDKQNYSSILNKLHNSADEDSRLYNKRKISKTFNPSVEGIFFIKNEKIHELENNILLERFDKLCRIIESDYGLNIFNYILNEAYEEEKKKYFEIEIFNYNFVSHKTVKSNLAADFVKELNDFIEKNFLKDISANKINKLKSNKTENVQQAQHNDLKSGIVKSAPKHEQKIKPEVKESAYKQKNNKAEIAKSTSGQSNGNKIPENIYKQKNKREDESNEIIIKTQIKPEETHVDDINIINKKENENRIPAAASLTDIHSEISLISLSWSSLSPKDEAPVLEHGIPVEINKSSWIRIYFQKPRVRKVVWRLRYKPDLNNIKPLLRVYADDNMLWYESLDSIAGDKYIILSKEFELSRVWAEIGYITEKNEFIFIARTPVWPPKCLFKSPPRKYSRKLLNNKISLIGATESLSAGNNAVFTSSGSGFYGRNK